MAQPIPFQAPPVDSRQALRLKIEEVDGVVAEIVEKSAAP